MRSHLGSNMASLGGSKSQILRTCEQNRYVLFYFTKQHDLREILPRSYIKVLRSFFKSDPILFLTNFFLINHNFAFKF